MIEHEHREYLEHGNLFAAYEVEEDLLPYVVDKMGEDLVLFASDYPRPECVAGAMCYLQEGRDLADSVKQKSLSESAARLFSL